ncbi:MAG: DUF2147 domain-containing protein [Rhodospirillaceae bacterium]|nr:DUF2147 domain-containing protein [Rhodospirillaceae bacterium]
MELTGALKFRALAVAAMALAAIALADRAAFAAEKLSPLGVWLGISDSGEKGHVKIYECGDKLCGKLVWSSKPESLDLNNPDESKRDKILIGQDILVGLEPDGENFWDGGRLYDATTGKTWNCNITVLPGNDKLKIRGYWGISLFGQSRVWDRVKQE